MRRVHPEFAYQSRELAGQIEGILGDPPNQKNYDLMVNALIGEYASGAGIEDVNMMSFALVDHIAFSDSKGLMREAAEYEGGDPAKREEYNQSVNHRIILDAEAEAFELWRSLFSLSGVTLPA